MTFSSAVKNELAGQPFEKRCCMHSEAYGMLLFAKSFSLQSIVLQTDNMPVAQRFCNLIKKLCGVSPVIRRAGGSAILVSVESGSDRMKILDFFGREKNETELRINRSNIQAECENCPRAFVRGCFFAGGSVTDPNKEYHFEFTVPRKRLAQDLAAFLGEFYSTPKITARRYNSVLYFKDSESIEDMLTFIGATRATLEMMNVKIYKDIRNRENRRNNCDVANIQKTAAAALRQNRAIDYIEKHGGLEILPKNLRELAVLRRENPDMSLSELGKSLDPKLTRSAVNRRFEKIETIAEHLREKGSIE